VGITQGGTGYDHKTSQDQVHKEGQGRGLQHLADAIGSSYRRYGTCGENLYHHPIKVLLDGRVQKGVKGAYYYQAVVGQVHRQVRPTMPYNYIQGILYGGQVLISVSSFSY